MRGHPPTGACYRDSANPCREPACCARNSRYQAERRRRRILKARRGQIEFTHGVNGYNHYACRCPICEAAQQQYRLARQAASQAPAA